MRLSTRVFWNSFIQVAGKILSTVLGLLAVALFARYLGSNGFGRYSTIVAFASVFAIIADLGLTLVTSQLINKNGAEESRLLGNLLAFRLLSAAVLVLPAPLIAQFMPYNAAVKGGIWLAALAFFFTSLNQVFVGLFQKRLRTDSMAVAEIISRLFLLVGVWLAVKYNWGLTGILAVTAVANFFSFLLHCWLSRRHWRLTWHFDWPVWRLIISQCWPLLVTIVLNLIYLKADIIILSLLKNERAVGLYGAAYKVVDVLVSLPFMFAGILLPILVGHWSAGRQREFKIVWQKFFDYTLLLALPLAAGGIVLAEPIMRLVVGPDFNGAGAILRILMLAVVAVFLSCFYTHTMVAWARQKKMIIYYLLTALTALPLYFWLISRYSYYGAAWVTVYSEIFILLGAAWAVWRQEHLMPGWHVAGKIFLATIIMALALWPLVQQATGGWRTLAVVVGGALIYVAALIVLRVLRWSDWAMIFNHRQKL